MTCPAILFPSLSFLSLGLSDQQIARLTFECLAYPIQRIEVQPSDLAPAQLPDRCVSNACLLSQPVERSGAFLKQFLESNPNHI